jgi:hypothetical protein
MVYVFNLIFRAWDSHYVFQLWSGSWSFRNGGAYLVFGCNLYNVV